MLIIETKYRKIVKIKKINEIFLELRQNYQAQITLNSVKILYDIILEKALISLKVQDLGNLT